MARTIVDLKRSIPRRQPVRRQPAFPGAKRLVKSPLAPQTPMKASGRRYAPGERKGKKNVSTKWPKGSRKGKRFIVTHKRPLLFEVGAKLLVQATSKNSFEILRVVHNKVARRP